MKRFIVLTLSCTVLVLLLSCQKNKSNPSETDAAEPDSTLMRPEPLVPDQKLNSSARLLAGLPLDVDDPLYNMTQTPEWEAYRVRMDELWNKSSGTLEKVKTIRENDLSDISGSAENVLYSFSGPDFPFVAEFFPESKNYYLLGLEKTGTPIDAEKVTQKTYDKYEKALRWMLQKSYFITSYMQGDLNNVEIDGTIPILSVLMTRMGYEILSIDYQNLTEEGEWEDAENHTRFVRIRFFNPGDTEPKSLYYLSTDISDANFNPRVLNMLSALDPDKTASFVKSCSYCLHYGSFAKIRNIILDHSFAIIQDDTGITYRTLLGRNFDVTLYGAYVEPMGHFPKGVFQKDLDKVYKESADIRPLGFRFGYNYKGSSLIVARRAEAASSE